MASMTRPPLLEIRKIEVRPPGRSAKRMVLPTHEAMAPAGATSQIASGLAPPDTFVFHSLPRALKPSQFPSDDQNGIEAPLEPSTSRTSTESRWRMYSDVTLARSA